MKLSVKFLIVAPVYGIIGICLGIVMGAQENFTLAPVHAHLNLIGWVLTTLYGLSYYVIPKLAESKMAKIQFYTVNGGVLLLVPSLALLLLGNKAIIPVLLLGELLTLGSAILYLLNVWNNRNSI